MRHYTDEGARTGDVFRSEQTVVSTVRAADGTLVIVKTPTAAIPAAAELARYRRERAFLSALAGPGIPKVIDLFEGEGTVRLVMEHSGRRSLADWMAERRLTTGEVLDILEEAAAVLARVHAAGVIHKDVAPANLVWAGGPGTLQLVDFGGSIHEGEAGATGRVDGTLRYIAPEATGRSGHAVTWRTDLYGLGATAWHLLVGRPPFEEGDPLALVHAHMARAPARPDAVDPTVPPCLSGVVLRLMEKDPERRYQSAEGLLADLRRCREAIARGDTAELVLGVDDVPPRFAIPDRLYGREKETAALGDALDAAARGGVSLALIEGPAGIGKSSLVGSLAERGVRIVCGRFEQVGRQAPLEALNDACDALVTDLLGIDELALARTREQLRRALGDGAGLLGRSIPSLGAVLGELPPVLELSDQAAAVRARQMYAALFAALASRSRPLVAFLDDHQWADAASLDVLEFLVAAPDIDGLLIVAGYRGEDVGPAHPVTRMRERIDAMGTPMVHIRPEPLDVSSTAALVADACRSTPEIATPLAVALCERTGGNPFFVRTLLSQMLDRGLLRREGMGWRWSADAAGHLPFSDNVVDAVLERIAALPADTTRALGVAARIGQRFDLRLLARALGLLEADVVAALGPALAAGLIRPESDTWGLLVWGADARAEGCRFVDGRVTEAALQLLAAEDAEGVHLRLGRLLTEDAPTGEDMFDALEHYRAALPIVREDERAPIARLALEACDGAARSAAFAAALRACEIGLLALGSRDQALWERLCTRAVQVADALGDVDALDRHVDALIEGASSHAATAPAYVARIRAHTRAQRFVEALDTANAFLGRVGRRIHTRLRALPVISALARVLWGMRGRSTEAIIDGPEGTDPTHVAVVSVQIASARALVSLHPEVAPLDILMDVAEVVRGGATPDGLFAWTGWSMLVAEALHRPDLAARYCERALARAERTGAPSWAGIAWVHFAVLDHWRTTLRETSAALHRTCERALGMGEVDMAIAASLLADVIGFCEGKPLSDVDAALRRTHALARRYRALDVLSSIDAARALVGALRGDVEPPTLAAEPQQGTFAEGYRAATHLARAVFLDDCATASRAAQHAPAAYLRTPMRTPLHFVWWTYRAVTLLRGAAAGHVAPREARKVARDARPLLARWAEAIPARRYRVLWIDAAEAALRGDHARAVELHEEAIELARSLGIRHDAALLAEHAAESAKAAGQTRLERVLLEEACAGYRQWGAEPKAAALAAATTARTSAPSTTASGDLDLETLFRASLSLAGEIRLDRLVGEVVAVAIQNAGATRGFLITEREGELVVAVGRDDEGGAVVAPETPLARVHGLATMVVRYVARTGERLVLANGADDPRFASDPHLRAGAVASILCAPLVHNGRRTGIMYLENHLVAGSFTPARLRTVQVLASQAAVAIENAHLVDTLEAKVAERTQALEDALARTRAQHAQLAASQQALIESEKMAALGQLVAGVAHELNTPLGAIRASVGNLSGAVAELGGVLDLVAETPVERRAAWIALVRKASASTRLRTTREDRASRRRVAAWLAGAGLPDSDDLAALLVEIGLGDEETDDLAPFLDLLRAERGHALLRGAYNVTAIARNGQNIRTAADRAAKIVFALKSYAHPGGAAGESSRASLADNLDTVLTLYQNHIKHDVELVRDYQDAGLVQGRHDELNQVWTNLLHNALQAMSYRGRLEVSVRAEGDDVLVAVTDDGPGIPEANLGRIFEPFFTTKAQGEGTGLGLSICREIVEKHGGRIGVESGPGRTRFTVRLPRA